MHRRPLTVVGLTAAALASAILVLPVLAADPPAAFPFFPSLLNTTTGKPILGDEFQLPKSCNGCHRSIYEQWYGSMHSKAMVDPVFVALWKVGVKETNGGVEKLCVGCHSGIGLVTGQIGLDPATGEVKGSEIALQGVQCDFCHTVKDHSILKTPTLNPQNASILVEPGRVKRGPYKDSKSPGHDTAYSELHTRSEFCGSCHNVFHPVTHFPIERTYEEWKETVYARADIQCQDCHMMPVEVAAETARTLKKGKNPGKAAGMGPDRERVRSHEFVGGNFTIPALLGHGKHAEIAKKRIQSAAQLEVLLPEGATRGNIAVVRVKVSNVGAGHNLPTSLTEVREMWLDVAVKDAAGKEVFRSGALDAKGDVDPEAVIYRAVAVDDKGHHTYKPWEISHFESVKTIPAKGNSVERYVFQVPADAAGPLAVSATLRYRSFPQALANQLLGKDAPVLPVVDMAVAAAPLAVK